LALIFLSTLLTAFVGSNLFTFVKDVLKMNWFTIKVKLKRDI
jgi:hypothetical protein